VRTDNGRSEFELLVGEIGGPIPCLGGKEDE